MQARAGRWRTHSPHLHTPGSPASPRCLFYCALRYPRPNAISPRPRDTPDPRHRCPERRAPAAALGLAAAVPGLCRSRLRGARPVAQCGHRLVRLHARTGPRAHLLDGPAAGRRAAGWRRTAALLAGRVGHPGAGRLAAGGACRAPAVRRAVAADPGGHLVQRVLPGAQPRRTARGLCLRRRGAARRLCPRHGRCRPAGLHRLPGTGPAVA